MYQKEELKQIKATIPHGGIMEISRKINVPYITVNEFLNGKRMPRNANEIMKGVLKYLKEMKEQSEEMKAFLNNINPA